LRNKIYLITFLFVFLLSICLMSKTRFTDLRKDETVKSAPMLKPWRSLQPDSAYHGVWLVAGDLDGDGQAEILTARNSRQEVTTLIASRLDGSELWHWGEPNTGKPRIGYDVPAQIYDLDADGQNEVYFCVKNYLLVLDGPTGKEIRRLPLPAELKVADCITFANVRGKKHPSDIIIKDRYHHIWVYSDTWQLLWDWHTDPGKTCHHPTLIDIDGDGRDEVLGGYTLLDDDGSELWTISSETIDLNRGHLDCCEILHSGKTFDDFRFIVTCCAAKAILKVDGYGKILWERSGHHLESVDAGKICADVPGKQIFVDIDHLPFGEAKVWLLDEQGELLGEYKCDYARHHRLIDWNGDGLDEILIGNSMSLFDGRGKTQFRFGPANAFAGERGGQKGGDAGPMAVTGDLDGDQRPEIILHSGTTVNIYKSDKAAKLSNTRVGTDINFTFY